MKRNRKATHIQWDVDDLEEISDYITDQTGFCHNGFIVED
mgnify:CR=1 FL=1